MTPIPQNITHIISGMSKAISRNLKSQNISHLQYRYSNYHLNGLQIKSDFGNSLRHSRNNNHLGLEIRFCEEIRLYFILSN